MLFLHENVNNFEDMLFYKCLFGFTDALELEVYWTINCLMTCNVWLLVALLCGGCFKTGVFTLFGVVFYNFKVGIANCRRKALSLLLLWQSIQRLW